MQQSSSEPVTFEQVFIEFQHKLRQLPTFKAVEAQLTAEQLFEQDFASSQVLELAQTLRYPPLFQHQAFDSERYQQDQALYKQLLIKGAWNLSQYALWQWQSMFISWQAKSESEKINTFFSQGLGAPKCVDQESAALIELIQEALLCLVKDDLQLPWVLRVGQGAFQAHLKQDLLAIEQELARYQAQHIDEQYQADYGKFVVKLNQLAAPFKQLCRLADQREDYIEGMPTLGQLAYLERYLAQIDELDKVLAALPETFEHRLEQIANFIQQQMSIMAQLPVILMYQPARLALDAAHINSYLLQQEQHAFDLNVILGQEASRLLEQAKILENDSLALRQGDSALFSTFDLCDAAQKKLHDVLTIMDCNALAEKLTALKLAKPTLKHSLAFYNEHLKWLDGIQLTPLLELSKPEKMALLLSDLGIVNTEQQKIKACLTQLERLITQQRDKVLMLQQKHQALTCMADVPVELADKLMRLAQQQYQQLTNQLANSIEQLVHFKHLLQSDLERLEMADMFEHSAKDIGKIKLLLSTLDSKIEGSQQLLQTKEQHQQALQDVSEQANQQLLMIDKQLQPLAAKSQAYIDQQQLTQDKISAFSQGQTLLNQLLDKLRFDGEIEVPDGGFKGEAWYIPKLEEMSFEPLAEAMAWQGQERKMYQQSFEHSQHYHDSNTLVTFGGYLLGSSRNTISREQLLNDVKLRLQHIKSDAEAAESQLEAITQKIAEVEQQMALIEPKLELARQQKAKADRALRAAVTESKKAAYQLRLQNKERDHAAHRLSLHQILIKLKPLVDCLQGLCQLEDECPKEQDTLSAKAVYEHFVGYKEALDQFYERISNCSAEIALSDLEQQLKTEPLLAFAKETVYQQCQDQLKFIIEQLTKFATLSGQFSEQYQTVITAYQQQINLQKQQLLEQQQAHQKEMAQRKIIVAKYLDDEQGQPGILSEYLEQRAQAYWLSDFIASIVAFFLQWPLGYQTEKQRRETYITETLKPALAAYQDDNSIAPLSAALLSEQYFFKPRAENGNGYLLSLSFIIESLKQELLGITGIEHSPTLSQASQV